MTAWCDYCGKSFRQRYDWQKLCPACYGLRQDNGGADAWMQVMDLKRELAFMRMQLASDQQQTAIRQAERALLDHIKENPKAWIMLTHPDRHNGSESATEVTRLILGTTETWRGTAPGGIDMAVTISRIDLESLIGPECAAWLVSQFGGQSIYIPRRVGAGRAIEAVVGAVAFEVLQAEYGGMNVNLPGKPRETFKDRIIPMIDAGRSLNEIAAQLGCTLRHVALIKSSMGLTKPSATQKTRTEVERNA